jgi:hypothetical protein
LDRGLREPEQIAASLGDPASRERYAVTSSLLAMTVWREFFLII